MLQLTVFKLIQNLWCYWEWKIESCQWLFLNEYIKITFSSFGLNGNFMILENLIVYMIILTLCLPGATGVPKLLNVFYLSNY